MKTILIAVFISVFVGSFVTACASSQPETTVKTEKPQAIPADVVQAIKDAQAAADKAASVEGEWRDTDTWIKQAKSAAKAGKYDKARELANKAKFEGDMGYKQAMEEKQKFDYKIKHNLPLF